jgi:hypothetical protein
MAKKVLLNMGLLLIFIVTGCLGGYVIASSAGSPGSTTWKEITSPPEKAVRIIEIGGYGSEANSITIQSESGKQFECCGPGPSPWKEVAYIKTRYGPECAQIESTLFDQLPGKPVDCAFISQFEYTTEQYYSAILDDGSVWRWHYVYGLSTIADAMIKGMLGGLILGVVWIAVRYLTSRTGPMEGIT